ncbi:DNA-binding protein [Thiohalophilus sp.]|uniref:helix-turn-helix transcriptional regulator n=1 Tax=Thiohalophilus sp. TaxID=3028392 RepID=UPI002ACEF809|nr:DNA-binding protein [Thiohalophilus sp.]MDZ7662827.1 DNA-binding protein [Thiohalophilus sp.]
MNEYDFTLKFSLPDVGIRPEDYVEALIANGCDDALIGIGQQGRIALNFMRDAVTAMEAVQSAIKDIKRVIPGARLVEAAPDLVGLTDVAEILGFSRQNMRKIMLGAGTAFPPPVHEGRPSIWHLAKILQWLGENGHYAVDDSLIELARVTMELNIVRELDDVDASVHDELLTLIA